MPGAPGVPGAGLDQLRHDQCQRAEGELLPSPFHLRGIGTEGYKDGYSWTLNRDTAEWFAQRLSGRWSKRVFVGTVSRDGVLAYLIDREEEEIISALKT